jgi:predicted CoA-binding protein
MTWHEPNDMERAQILNKSKTVAIVGASDNTSRASFFVITYLLASSNFDLYFVNPAIESILGKKTYKSLKDIPVPIDIVDVFRKPDAISEVMDEAIAIKAKTFWMQLGISNQEVAEKGAAAGMNVVQNRCLKIEHARFNGGLHLAGFDTGVINSKRNLK